MKTIFDPKSIVTMRGPKLVMVGPYCAQEVFEDGRRGNLVYMK